MIETLYQTIVSYIHLWGYWGVLVGMALESACMPVPSEIVLPFGGYLVSQGVMEFWEAVMAGLMGGYLDPSSLTWRATMEADRSSLNMEDTY